MLFGRVATAEEVTEGIDLTGKTAVITGVNSGLGEEAMRVLCLRGARVYGLARSLEKARQACGRVSGEALPFECELGDWQSVKDCAQAIRATGRVIDILIANAGIMAPKKLSLHHGLESQFAINHMGHFVLIHQLLEQVKEASEGRIVLLSSDAHKTLLMLSGGIDFDNLDGARGYSPWKFYGWSKLANVMLAKALTTRLEGSSATANAVHPGVIETGLGRDAGLTNKLAYLFSKPIGVNVPQGAATGCYVATSADVRGVSGEYFSNCRRARPNSLANDAALIERLWSYSEQAAHEYIA